jgi:hypothetical protein
MTAPARPPELGETKDNLRLVSLIVLLLSGVALLSTYLVGKSAQFKPDFLARSSSTGSPGEPDDAPGLVLSSGGT